MPSAATGRGQRLHNFCKQRAGRYFWLAAAALQFPQGPHDLRGGGRVAVGQQLFEQTGESAHFQPLQGGAPGAGGVEEAGRAEVAEQGGTIGGVQDVVGIQIAVQDALGMQMCPRRSHAPRQAQHGGEPKRRARGVHVAGAGGQAWRPGQVAKCRINQCHHQALGAGRMVGDFTGDGNQVGVGPGANAGGYLAVRQPVAGHRPPEYFHGYGLRRLVGSWPPPGSVDDARCSFAQLLF